MIDVEHLCPGCMKQRGSMEGPCPHCGYTSEQGAQENVLPPFFILEGRYLLGRCLGKGGFGISYLALDLLSEEVVAIKEYFPAELAARGADGTAVVPAGKGQALYFRCGMRSFSEEARLLGLFSTTPGIVRSRGFLQANGSSYLVMDYVEGTSLRSCIRSRKEPFSETEALGLMRPILSALAVMHEKGVLHRDISPENLILGPDGQLTLIDFGAAREVSSDEDENLTVIIKRGYAPQEQYRSGSKQGPWTDLYAACAVLYHMLTGGLPQEASARAVNDQLTPLSQRSDLHISAATCAALEKGLQVDPVERYPSIPAMMRDLYPDEGGATEAGTDGAGGARATQGAARTTAQAAGPAVVSPVGKGHEPAAVGNNPQAEKATRAATDPEPLPKSPPKPMPGAQGKTVPTPQPQAASQPQAAPTPQAVPRPQGASPAPAADRTASAASRTDETPRAKHKRPKAAAIAAVVAVLIVGLIALSSGGSSEGDASAPDVPSSDVSTQGTSEATERVLALDTQAIDALNTNDRAGFAQIVHKALGLWLELQGTNETKALDRLKLLLPGWAEGYHTTGNGGGFSSYNTSDDGSVQLSEDDQDELGACGELIAMLAASEDVNAASGEGQSGIRYIYLEVTTSAARNSDALLLVDKLYEYILSNQELTSLAPDQNVANEALRDALEDICDGNVEGMSKDDLEDYTADYVFTLWDTRPGENSLFTQVATVLAERCDHSALAELYASMKAAANGDFDAFEQVAASMKAGETSKGVYYFDGSWALAPYPSGSPILIVENDIIYFGDVTDGMRCGQGVQVSYYGDTGDSYMFSGSWSNNLPNGVGTCYRTDSDGNRIRIQGTFASGLENGSMTVSMGWTDANTAYAATYTAVNGIRTLLETASDGSAVFAISPEGGRWTTASLEYAFGIYPYAEAY